MVVFRAIYKTLVALIIVAVIAAGTILAVPQWRDPAIDWVAEHSKLYQTTVDSNDELTEETIAQSEEIEILTGEKADLIAQLILANDDKEYIQALYDLLASERAAKAQLQARLEAEIAEKESLQEQLDSANTNIEVARAVLDEKNASISLLQSEIAEKNATIESLNSSLASKTAEAEEYKQQVIALGGELETLQSFKYGKYVWSEEVPDGTFEDVFVEVQNNGKVKFYFDSENFALFDYVQNENRITVNFVEDNEVHPIEFVLTSNASFESTDEDTPMSFVYCDETLESVLESRQILQEELRGVESDKSVLELEVESLNSQVTSLNSQLSEITTQRDSLQSELATANSNISSLNQELSVANSSIQTLTQQVNTLNTDKIALTNLISTLEGEKLGLETRISELESELETFEQYTLSIDQTNPVETIIITDSKLNTVASVQDVSISQITLYTWQTIIVKYASQNNKNIVAMLNGVSTGSNTVTISGEGKHTYSITSFDEYLSDFKSDISNAGEITLTHNVVLDTEIEITEDTTIDLNGHAIYGANINGAVFKVMPGVTLTLYGDGSVVGGSGADCRAVEVQGTLNVYDGNYFVGPDADGYGNSTIYASANNAVVNIYGGHFESAAAWNNFYYVLNVKNSVNATVNVYGGEFVNYDPSVGDDNLGGNFVAEGYEVIQDGDCYIVEEIYTEIQTVLEDGIYHIKNIPQGSADLKDIVFTIENGEISEYKYELGIWLSDSSIETFTQTRDENLIEVTYTGHGILKGNFHVDIIDETTFNAFGFTFALDGTEKATSILAYSFGNGWVDLFEDGTGVISFSETNLFGSFKYTIDENNRIDAVSIDGSEFTCVLDADYEYASFLGVRFGRISESAIASPSERAGLYVNSQGNGGLVIYLDGSIGMYGMRKFTAEEIPYIQWVNYLTFEFDGNYFVKYNVFTQQVYQ